MNKFNIDTLLELAGSALDTDYARNADWRAHYLQEIVANLEEDKDCDDYDDEDVIEAVENLAYADETVPMPPELQSLFLYVYGIAVELEDSARINDIGAFYYTGHIGVQDFKKAEYYYKLATELGNSYSIENLGYIYYYGRIGEVNYEKAYHQFTKGSAAYNRAISTYKLGDMYKNGYYVERDPRAALRCYQRAEKLIDNGQHENRAENCAPDIYFRLGEAYQRGMAVEQDLDKALAYYQKAELGFIDKVRSGDYLVKKLLTLSIDRQEEIRQEIARTLPAMDWAKKNTGYNSL